MQAHHMLLVLGTTLLATTDAGYQGSPAGYYKRPPPPSKLHYLPKPPPHYHKSPQSFYRRPSPIHAPRNPIRPPPRPYFNKPTPPPPPPFPPASWKTHSNFRAPAVKEQFHSSPLAFTPEVQVTQHFLPDDDKGPIHTIPAPNLSPADRPANLGQEHNSALDAVFKHADDAVRAKPAAAVTYQVTEDPSAYKPYSGPSYFAPDPDPSLPTIEVPQTTDPHSVPSNGVTPLDIYQQQVADQAARQQYDDGTVGVSTLSPQDLYHLLHGAQQQMTPQLYQQYLQAAAAHQPTSAIYQQQQQPTSASAVYQQVFQAGLLYPQQYQQPSQVAQFSQQNFHPQFENFNYNEQTQESAHGSDSFPSASSISMGVKRAVSKDTRISGESINKIPVGSNYLDKTQGEESNEVGVISNQVDYEDEQSTEESERETFPPNLSSGYYTTLPNKQAADALATLAAAGSINQQLAKSQEKQENHSHYSMQGQRGEEMRKQQRNEEQQRAEQERRQQVIRHEQERLNEIREQEEQRKQMFNNQEIQTQENQQIRQQDYLNHDMKGSQISNQNPRNQDNRETQRQTNSGKESTEQVFTDSEYSDDEILDTSDKDQRTINSHMQKVTMRPYDTSYYRQKIEQENKSQTTEESYEDTDSDYSQEEAKEINNTNKMTKPSAIPEKSFNYNAHQNQLPFGAKLRPKRV